LQVVVTFAAVPDKAVTSLLHFKTSKKPIISTPSSHQHQQIDTSAKGQGEDPKRTNAASCCLLSAALETLCNPSGGCPGGWTCSPILYVKTGIKNSGSPQQTPKAPNAKIVKP